MARVDWVRRISSVGASERVVPFSHELSACRDVDHSVWDVYERIGSPVADDNVGGDMRDGLREKCGKNYLSAWQKRMWRNECLHRHSLGARIPTS